jgi:osmotically-inducible protein OsmY
MAHVKNDESAALEIAAEIRWELGPKGSGVRADVLDGVAVLSGRVQTTDERRRAAASAQQVPGVLDVVNALGVVVSAAPAAQDLVLAHAVRRALEWDSFAPDERIHATVCGGWVTLEGSVDHLADGADAERAVRELVDVRGVTNLIEVGWIGAGAHGRRAALAHAS